MDRYNLKKLTKLIFVCYVLAFCLVFVVSPAMAEDIFEEKYDANRMGEYLGSICGVTTGGDIYLPPEIQSIVDKSVSPTHSVIIKSGNYTMSIPVDDNGLKQLEYLSKQIYDSASIKSRVKQMGSQVDVRADTQKAGTMLSGLAPLVSLIVGLLLYVVVFGMAIFTALDICYITMPIFRNKAEELKQEGNRLVTNTNKQGEVKLRWVSDEAQYVVKAYSIDSGKNPLAAYLMKRIWAYVMVGIVIYILMTGNVQLFVDIAINMVSGILDVLADLGR